MLKFLTYTLQLILSPREGWEDLGKADPDPDYMLTHAYYPLLGIATATTFLELVFRSGESVASVIIQALATFGAYFVALYVAKLVFEVSLSHLSVAAVDHRRAFMLIQASLGMMLIFRIISNFLPWHLIVIDFLPLYVILVLSKSYSYLGIARREEIRYLGIASGVTVGIPLAIYYLIYLVTK